MKKYFFSTLFLISSFFCIDIFGQGVSYDSVLIFNGQPAPDFKLQTISGVKYNLQELKGKIVVINFWTSHCPPCIKGMPGLFKVSEEYKDSSVIFISACASSLYEIEQLQKKTDLKFDIVSDCYKLHSDYKIDTYPSTVFIDKNGIVFKCFFSDSEESIKKILTKELHKY